jgi:hypothetical protein
MMLEHDDMIDVGRDDEAAAASRVGDPGHDLGDGLIHSQRVDFDPEELDSGRHKPISPHNR